MTEHTQKESEAIYNASRENIYYNLLLDLRDLGYKPKEIVEITNVNPNSLRGQLYKHKNSESRSGLNFLVETLLNYLSISVLLEKSNKNALLSIIENLQGQLKGIEDSIQMSLTEADVEEKVEEISKQISGEMESIEDGLGSLSNPQEAPSDFDPEYPGSTEEAPFGFTQEGTPRKVPPRKRKRKRRS